MEYVYFYIFYNFHTVQSSNHIHTIHSPRPLSIPHRLWLSEKDVPVVPSRESNSGLPSSKPTRYQLSHAAPSNWATPHHEYVGGGGLESNEKVWGNKELQHFKSLLQSMICKLCYDIIARNVKCIILESCARTFHRILSLFVMYQQ
jgi:hypothetical protein